MNVVEFETLPVESQWFRLRNPYYLPTQQQVETAFSRVPVDETGNRVWNEFCAGLIVRGSGYMDILTKEYVGALADYLSTRAAVLRNGSQRPLKVLEIEAGDARLAYHLRKELDPRNLHYHVSDSRKPHETAMVEDIIEGVSMETALSALNPAIVVCNWMPYRADWTALIRGQPSVLEYMLIGETDGGCCGDEWLTWGLDNGNNHAVKIPLYKRDGFNRSDLRDVDGNWHLSATDESPYFPTHSSTVSFRRQ